MVNERARIAAAAVPSGALLAIPVTTARWVSPVRRDVPERLAAPTRALHEAVVGKVQDLLAARAPDLPEEQRARVALVTVRVFGTLMPVVVGAETAERGVLLGELKAVLRGYLDPIVP